MGTKYQGPPDRLELYEAVVSIVEGLETKGATMPYTSMNGHMTSFLDPEGSAAIRLNPEDRRDFIERYDSRIAVQYGKEMKEFVVVPDDLLERTEEIGMWLAASWNWVGTRPPKPPK